MNVLMVMNHFYPFIGGAEKLFLELALGLVKSGQRVKVLTSGQGVDTTYCNYQGIEIYYYPWKVLWGQAVPDSRDLSDHIKWCDVIHSAIYMPATRSLRYGRKCGKPVICTVYEALTREWMDVESSWLKGILYRVYTKWVIEKRYSALHAISHSTEKQLQAFRTKCPVRMIYCPMGIEQVEISDCTIRERFSIKNDFCGKVFLYYGRPGKTKGIFVLLEAVRELLIRDPSLETKARFCFVLAQEPEKERIAFCKEAEKDDMRSCVHIISSQSKPDLNALISDADCVIVPSMTEGFGYSAVEACNLNTSLICSTAGALPEVVYGKCMFFQNKNAQDLADKIYSVISDKAIFAEIEKKDFSSEKTIGEFIKLYEEAGLM